MCEVDTYRDIFWVISLRSLNSHTAAMQWVQFVQDLVFLLVSQPRIPVYEAFVQKAGVLDLNGKQYRVMCVEPSFFQ